MVHVALNPMCTSRAYTMVPMKYSKLKELITLKVGMSEMHSQIIEAMKDLYRNDINSVRRFEQIRTIGQLIKILEIRDLLSEDNILPLEVLATRLPKQPDLDRCIEDYKKIDVPGQRSNTYVAEHTQAVMPPKEPPVKDGKYSSFMDGISDKRRERIIKTVIEQIGSYWRNLARYLDVKEYKIDEIQVKYKTLSEKASEVMDIYYEKADRQKWFFDLISALEKAKRRDLSDELKRIATMNI